MEKPAWSDSLDNIAWGGGSVLPLVFPYRELDFYSCAFWKRCVFRQAGVAVCYCTGSVAGRGVLTFCSIQSTGWHGRINIRWLDDEVLTIVFISTLSSSKGGKFFLACQGLHKPPVTCGRLHIDPRFNISSSWFSGVREGLSTYFHLFLFRSSQHVSSAPRFLFYFSTKSMGSKRQPGSSRQSLAQGSGILQLLPGRSHRLDPASHASYCGKGTRGSEPQQAPAAQSWCQPVLPGQLTWSARSLRGSQGHSPRVTDHCIQNKCTMLNSDLQSLQDFVLRFWLIN